jgi:hypothetical protein
MIGVTRYACPVCSRRIDDGPCLGAHCGVYRHEDGSVCGHAWVGVAWQPVDIDPEAVLAVFAPPVVCAAGLRIMTLEMVPA